MRHLGRKFAGNSHFEVLIQYCHGFENEHLLKFLWPQHLTSLTLAPALGGKLPVFMHLLSCMLSRSVVSDSAIPRTIALQTPLFMGFSRQEYWSGLPYPSQGTFLTQGSNLHLLRLLQFRGENKQVLYH